MSAATSAFAGFSTGRGTKVTVSAASLAKASSVLGGDDSVSDSSVSAKAQAAKAATTAATPAATPAFAGFSTGRGKKVTVSAASLAEASSVLGGDSSRAIAEPAKAATPAATPAFAGFSTGRGKKVAVSAASVAKAAKMIYPELDRGRWDSY